MYTITLTYTKNAWMSIVEHKGQNDHEEANESVLSEQEEDKAKIITDEQTCISQVQSASTCQHKAGLCKTSAAIA